MTAAAATLALVPTLHEIRHPLRRRAERLYPDSLYLQAEWMRAIAVVRATRRGWLLDRPTPRRGLA